MSEVYIKEPATTGKAVFQTTHGDLEIEMWATETPKACRNFCQLILEGYYNGTIFHRVIKDFIVQGGDGTGTGDGCESIYGSPYPDEIHPRLKFRYRGMMGIASAGKGTKTNGSQFFIVMNRTPSLDGKHTLFAKVVGQTVYNLVRISECEVDKKDRPVEPPRVIRAELVWDPFGDLEPRKIAAPPVTSKPVEEVHRRAPVKNKKVLSFAEGEDSDDEDEPKKQGSKSAHDLLNEGRLKKEAAYAEEKRAKPSSGKRPAAEEAPSKAVKRAAGGTARGSAPPKKAADDEADWGGSGSDDDSSDEEEDKAAMAKSRQRQEEILKLKKGIATVGHEEEAPARAKKQMGSALEQQRAGYKTRQKVKTAQGREEKKKREADMMAVMRSFRDRLQNFAGGEEDEEEAEEAEKEKKEEKEIGTLASIWDEGEEEVSKGWLKSGGLKFHTSGDKAFKMAADRARETLEIFDPLLHQGNAEVLAAEMKKRTVGMQAPSRKKDDKKGKEKDFGDPRRRPK